MQNYAKLALNLAKERNMFVVLDADGLYMAGQDLTVIKGYRKAVLTPNVVEFKRLAEQVGIDPGAPAPDQASSISRALGGVAILQKGKKDLVAIDTTGDEASLKTSGLNEAEGKKEAVKEEVEVDTEGGLKRCGGQGDILSGTVGAFLAWAKCYEDGAFG
jgi:ATP-dependent NAD(P)H-hydrate dehydratase